MEHAPKYQLNLVLLLVGLLCTTLHNVSLADSATLEITFLKKPPRTGIFYAVENKASGKHAHVDQIEKKFTADINVVDSAGELIFENSDKVDHNIYINDTRNQIQFDTGLMVPEQTINIPVTWKNDTLVRLGCKIHPKMRTYLANINTENYIILDFKDKNPFQKFTLDNIGDHITELAVLFPGYDPIKIPLDSGQSNTVTVTKKGKEKASATISRQ